MSENKSTRPVTDEQWHAMFLRESVQSVAANLRQLADEVERATRGIDKIGNPGWNSYGQVAAEVQHALAWGFANLNASRVTGHATDADIARIRGDEPKALPRPPWSESGS